MSVYISETKIIDPDPVEPKPRLLLSKLLVVTTIAFTAGLAGGWIGSHVNQDKTVSLVRLSMEQNAANFLKIQNGMLIISNQYLFPQEDLIKVFSADGTTNAQLSNPRSISADRPSSNK